MHFNNSVLLEISNNPAFQTPGNASAQDVANGVDWYINSLTNFYQGEEPWLESEFINSCKSFFESALYKNYSTAAQDRLINRMQTAAIASANSKELWVEFLFLSLSAEQNHSFFVSLKEARLYTLLSSVILDSNDKTIIYSAIHLCYEILVNIALYPFEYNNRIDQLVVFLLGYVEKTYDSQNEEYTQTATLLLLSLNSFFYRNCKKLYPLPGFERVIKPRRSSDIIQPGSGLRSSFAQESGGQSEGGGRSNSRNRVPAPQVRSNLLRALEDRHGKAKGFSQNIVFLLNRSNGDSIMLPYVITFLNHAFKDNALADLFYTNDMCILVDIFIRELESASEVDYKISKMYLTSLEALLSSPPYILTRHRLDEVVLTLVQMLRRSLEDHTVFPMIGASVSNDRLQNGYPRSNSVFVSNHSHNHSYNHNHNHNDQNNTHNYDDFIYEGSATAAIGNGSGSGSGGGDGDGDGDVNQLNINNKKILNDMQLDSLHLQVPLSLSRSRSISPNLYSPASASCSSSSASLTILPHGRASNPENSAHGANENIEINKNKIVDRRATRKLIELCLKRCREVQLLSIHSTSPQ